VNEPKPDFIFSEVLGDTLEGTLDLFFFILHGINILKRSFANIFQLFE